MQNETVYPEMTIEDIETQFDGEWVLIGDPETDEKLEIVRGKVLCHNVDRQEFDRIALAFRDGEIKSFAWLYNDKGEIPEGTAILL